MSLAEITPHGNGAGGFLTRGRADYAFLLTPGRMTHTRAARVWRNVEGER